MVATAGGLILRLPQLAQSPLPGIVESVFNTTRTESIALTAQADDGRVLVVPARSPEGFFEDSPRFSERRTSGWLGVELDIAAGDVGAMDAAGLVEAIVGFDRLVSWAAARQSARQSALLAEFARRRPAVQDKVLVRAPEQTAGQVRAAVARAVISVDPAGAAERHREARRDRRVAINPDQDGMASPWVLLPAPDTVSAFEWLTRLARGTDPLSGALLDYGRTTYGPPAALADFVRDRDVGCRHPVCRRRAIDSELDHTIAFAGGGGTTAESNLSVVQDEDGRINWTTPTGHAYSSTPYDYRIDEPPGPRSSTVASTDTGPPFR